MTIKDLEIIKGNSKTYTVNFIKNGVAIDITGWTVIFIVKKSLNSVINIIKKENTSHFNPTGGVSKIPMLPGDTNQAASGKYIYSLKTITAQSEVFTIAAGAYRIKEV